MLLIPNLIYNLIQVMMTLTISSLQHRSNPLFPPISSFTRNKYFFWPLACPHSVVTRIGSVTRDQKVPGSNPVWVGCCGVDIYQWFNKGLVVCITVCGCVHLKDPLESVEKSRGLSPGSGFLSVADMSITVTKGDVKLQ